VEITACRIRLVHRRYGAPGPPSDALDNMPMAYGVELEHPGADVWLTSI